MIAERGEWSEASNRVAAARVALRSNGSTEPRQPLRVLMIEDDEDDYLLASDMFRDLDGYQVALERASTYDAGLAILSRDEHDVYLIDYRLGARTGLDLMREAQGKGCGGPMIMLTGFGDRDVDVAAMATGAADYLVKGHTDPVLLERTIRYAVERAHAEREWRTLRAREQAARDDALATVVHDLNNPLAAIKGRAQLLQREAATAGTAELSNGLLGIDAATSRMARLINELLDSARLRAGELLPLERRPTDLVTLVRQTVAEYQQSTPRHHIQVDAALPTMVGHWDAYRLERVLANLLSNAIKYSPGGGSIAVRVYAENGDTAVVQVQDEGLGIPQADLPHLFERFRRAGNVDNISGTGLGLAGARQVVEQHAGTLGVESQEGAGTTITIRLPQLAHDVSVEATPHER